MLVHFSIHRACTCKLPCLDTPCSCWSNRSSRHVSVVSWHNHCLASDQPGRKQLNKITTSVVSKLSI